MKIWFHLYSDSRKPTILVMKSTTLAIESTCDDSSIAIVTLAGGDFKLEKMITHTQGMHQKYGWVVPEYASREHTVWLPKLIEEMNIKQLNWKVLTLIDWKEIYIDSISVASHPWLPWSIVAWVSTAHALWHSFWLPVIEVNHIMWHVFSILLDRNISILDLPYLCLTVSGGHSDIYLVLDNKIHIESTLHNHLFHKLDHVWVWEVINVGPYQAIKLVQTMDDAVGEAFDKVAKMLGWPYPGGPWINKLAATWVKDERISQRLRKIDISGQFSFSWIKAQVHSLIEYLKREEIVLDESMLANICRLFQDRVTTALSQKFQQSIDTHSPKTLWVVWWVSANTVLQDKSIAMWEIYFPTKIQYCSDNAAMIGVVALLSLLKLD